MTRRYLRTLAMVLGILLLVNGAGVLALSAEERPSLDQAFWNRDWKLLDSLYQQGETISPRELSLVANAFWLQGRWKEALDVLQRIGSELPEELIPYRDMMIVLAHERTGNIAQALQAAHSLYSRAPEGLNYYVAYALYRLTATDEEKRGWLEAMLKLSTSQAQTVQTLNELLSLPGDNVAYGLQLVRFEPLNKKAFSVLEKSPEPWNAAVAGAVGYAAYLKGDYKKAISLFLSVPLDSAEGLKSRYYRAMSCYRLERYKEALDLWEWLAMNGKGYAESSIRRIGVLAGRAEEEKAIASLRRIADSGPVPFRSKALFALFTVADGDVKKNLELELIERYPTSEGARSILWDRAWEAWKKERTEDALVIWEQLLSGGEGVGRERLLYWTARGYEKVGEKNKAEERFYQLLAEYPLSIYSSLASPGGPSFSNEIPSELNRSQGILEKWGFVFYAKLSLLKEGTPSAMYRAAVLSEWLGDEAGAYSTVSSLSSTLLKNVPLPREGIRFLYPRPFKNLVESASQRFGVEGNLIWAVMRQESAFDADVNSWVGAVGLMQLMPATGQEEARLLEMGNADLWDPATNILLGASHLARLQKRFRRLEWAVAAYNAGSGSVGKWIKEGEDRPFDEWMEDIPYNETRNYVRKVMGNLFIYRVLY